MGENNSTQLLNELENEIHVWFCCPDEINDETKLAEYRSILSVEENDKFKRFHFAKDRHSYLVSHALVRKALSMYCEIRPEEWCFTSNQHGKPDISPDIKSPALKFNLSHTDGMSVCVISLDSDCGVDVENIYRKSRTFEVAERMFAPAEIATMQSCHDDDIQGKFFEYWTLREAYVKALGTGLGGSSKDFYFSIAEQDGGRKDAGIHFVPADDNKSESWRFLLLNLSSAHVVSVSIKDETDVTRTVVSHKIKP